MLFGLDPESRRTILVGSGNACDVYAGQKRMLTRYGRSTVLGLVGEEQPWSAHPGGGIQPLGVMRDIDEIVDLWRPDELVVVDRDVERSHLGELADLCRRRRMTLKLVDLEMRFDASGVCLIPDADRALFVAATSAPSRAAWMLKRFADLAVATAVLLLAAPFLVVIAVTIKLTSPGPVFFVDARGLGQRTFRLYKFRTMVANAAGGRTPSRRTTRQTSCSSRCATTRGSRASAACCGD